MPSVIPPGVDRSTTGSSGRRSPTGRLLFSAAAGAASLRTPIAPMCGECRSVEWDTQESPGTGSIVPWIVSHHPTQPDAEPRIVVLVELDEGVRFVSNVARRRARRRSQNDLAVELTFRTVDDVALPQFRLRPPGARDGAPEHGDRRHRPDRVLEGLGPQRAPARGGGGHAAIADAGLTPGRHRRRGHVRSMDANDELASLRSARHPRAALHRPHPVRRRRRVGDAADWRRPRSTPGMADASWSTARSTSGRAVASASRSPRTTVARRAAGLELLPPVRARHAGEDVRALVPALHARVTA